MGVSLPGPLRIYFPHIKQYMVECDIIQCNKSHFINRCGWANNDCILEQSIVNISVRIEEIVGKIRRKNDTMKKCLSTVIVGRGGIKFTYKKIIPCFSLKGE